MERVPAPDLIGKVRKLESFHASWPKAPLLLHQPFATATGAKTAAPSPDAPLPAETPFPRGGPEIEGASPAGETIADRWPSPG